MFNKNKYSWQDWTDFFREYYGVNPFTSTLKDYLVYPMFWWFDDNVHFKLQLAHKIALLAKVDKILMSSESGNILSADKIKRNEVFTILNVLFAATNEDVSVLTDSTKQSIVATVENWIISYPEYYQRTGTISGNLYPYRALLAFQMHLLLLGYEELNAQRITYLSTLLGLPEKYASIFRVRKLYIADNNKMSDKDLAFIDKIMTLIPDTLTKLRSLSNIDYYYETNQERMHVECGNLGAVNTFSTVGGYQENGFPADVAPQVMDGFSIVVAHEINHRLDPDYIYLNTSLKYRRSQLIQQASSVDLQYLRSWEGSGAFFQSAPQEFIASIANQWFCNSEHTLNLGLIRFNKGYHEPINQVLYYCELYSLGSNQTRFYSTDINANITFRHVEIARDHNGHINQLTNNRVTYHFNVDESGNVLSYSVSQPLSFRAGWNLFSFSSVPANPDMKKLFLPLTDNGLLVKIQDETGNSFEDFGAFGGWTNNIGSISLTEGYKIKVTSDCQITLTGTPALPPLGIPLKAGWNMIGFPYGSEADGMWVVQKLIDRGTLVKVQDETGKSIEDLGIFGGWINNIGNFIPGEGYKIKVRTNESLTIQESYPK